MLGIVLSGNTFDVKEKIKTLGFTFSSANKNWERWSEHAEKIAEIEESLGMMEDVATAGVRMALLKNENSLKRVINWKDFGRVRRGAIAAVEEGEAAVVAAPVIDQSISINYPNRRFDSTLHPSVTAAAPTETRVRIALWIARVLNCSRTLEGNYVGELERREITFTNGSTRNYICRHFVGHNAIGGTDRCHRCSRELTHPVSRLIGYGPECCHQIGISRRVDMNDLNNVETMDRLIREQVVDVWIPIRRA